MGPAVKNTHEASALLQALCQQPGVTLEIPASDDWDVIHQLMREGDLSARLCTVAYLAALAISKGWRLVSFNRDFERFGDLQRLSLSSGGPSDQPTLIQLSDGLKFRILMQQRCSAKTSRCGDPGISNGKPMQRLDPGGFQQ